MKMDELTVKRESIHDIILSSQPIEISLVFRFLREDNLAATSFNFYFFLYYRLIHFSEYFS